MTANAVGQELEAALGDAFARIAAAERYARAGPGGTLILSAVPSFAAQWLVLRLGRFRARNPEIDLRCPRPTSLPTSSATRSSWRSGMGAAAGRACTLSG